MRNGPKYSPRDYCQNWRRFGKDDTLRFRAFTGDLDHDALVVASIQQHRFALAVRAALREQGLSVVRLAVKAGMARSKLSDVLNGERPLRLSDMGRIMVTLDLHR